MKEREETERRKGADSAVSRRQAGKKSKEQGCGLKNKEYNFKLDSEAEQSVRALTCMNANFFHERPNQNFRSCCDTPSIAAPKHLCAATADPAFLGFAFIC